MGKGGAAWKEEEEGEEKKERGRFLSLPADVGATMIRLISAAGID